jgi:hypothetical protein
MTSPAAPPSPPAPATDWPAQVTDAVVNVVDSVKDKTTGPATSAARGVVYGLLGAIVGTAALVIFLVLLFRGIDILVQLVLDAAGAEKAGRSVWIAHTIMGLLFLVPGLMLWRRGSRAQATAS